ncbi:MAG: hypothetical protein CM1200mP40_00360 [Gammaproteobacteria bacterium]|nr:MAG: hypothetical protein CM1200mP40_00360 [Gammaproteobacteria bacterium]
MALEQPPLSPFGAFIGILSMTILQAKQLAQLN